MGIRECCSLWLVVEHHGAEDMRFDDAFGDSEENMELSCKNTFRRTILI